MKRKIYDEMVSWKNNWAGKTALLLDGPRRVGKSYIAEEFARSQYQSYILIDFNRAGDEIKDLFLHYLLAQGLKSFYPSYHCKQVLSSLMSIRKLYLHYLH